MMDFQNMVWEVWFAWIAAILILGYVIRLLIISNKRALSDKNNNTDRNETFQSRIPEGEELKRLDKMTKPELKEYLQIRIDKDMN